MELAAELREQGRGMAGALLVLGISFVYTIETWRLAVDIHPLQLLLFLLLGLALVVPITRSVGFRSASQEEPEDLEDPDAADPDSSAPGETSLPVEVAEIFFQSLFVGYSSLLLLGIVDLRMPPSVFVNTGLIQVVPLAFGAALANELLSVEQQEIPEVGFPKSLGVFALGAIFFSAPIAPTDEVAIIASQVEWTRLAAILVVSLVIVYLMLYELEFRGQAQRLQGRSRTRQTGQAALVYVVAFLAAFVLLVALADIEREPFPTWLRQTIVLAFPASIGASGARVVLA